MNTDMLILAADTAAHFLTKLFNAVFDKEVYSEEWSKAIIIPIFKKRNKNNTNNCRGISLLSLICKCYTSALNKRVISWAEGNDKLSDAQAGFRQGYSTTDHNFTLGANVEKSLSKEVANYIHVSWIKRRSLILLDMNNFLTFFVKMVCLESF